MDCDPYIFLQKDYLVIEDYVIAISIKNQPENCMIWLNNNQYDL
jgi:hypothetical protein